MSEAIDWHSAEDEVFSVDVAHDVVEKYQPEFVGKGSEHIVYSSPEHPKVVIKINLDSIETSLRYLHAGHTADGMLSDDEFQSDVRDWKLSRKESFNELRQHFGQEHTLKERQVLIKVPRIQKVVSAYAQFRIGYDVSQDHLPDELLVAATIQENSESFLAEDRISLHSSYATVPDEEYYENLRQAVAGVESGEDISDVEKEPDVDSTKDEVISDFVTRAVQYSNETGKILDVAGSDNVILHKENGEWTYTLVDALYPDNRMPTLDELENTIISIVQGSAKLNPGEMDEFASRIENVINYVTYINNLAAKHNCNERVEFLNSEFFKTNWEEVQGVLQSFRQRWLAEQIAKDF